MNGLADFVAFAGPAGVISGVVGHLLTRWAHRSDSRAQARYLALRVAITLERFAGDCLNLISAIDTGVTLNANPDSLPINLPVLPDYPADDAGWRVMKPDLADAAFGVHVERAMAQGAIADEWAYGGPSAAPFECARLAARIGSRAWAVAADLRRAYTLPPYRPEHDVGESLRRRTARDEEAQAASATRVAEMLAAPSAPGGGETT